MSKTLSFASSCLASYCTQQTLRLHRFVLTSYMLRNAQHLTKRQHTQALERVQILHLQHNEEGMQRCFSSVCKQHYLTLFQHHAGASMTSQSRTPTPQLPSTPINTPFQKGTLHSYACSARAATLPPPRSAACTSWQPLGSSTPYLPLTQSHLTPNDRRYYSKQGLQVPSRDEFRKNPVKYGMFQGFKPSALSTNVIVDPYYKIKLRDIPPPWKFECYEVLFKLLRRTTSRMYSNSQLRRVYGFNFWEKVSKGILNSYEDAKTYIATGDLQALRQVCTPLVADQLERELQQRKRLGHDRQHWSLVEPLDTRNMSLLQLSVTKGFRDETFEEEFATYVQVTVKIRSMQRYCVYDAQGKVVRSSGSGGSMVEDVWVFEKALSNQYETWLVLGRYQDGQLIT